MTIKEIQESLKGSIKYYNEESKWCEQRLKNIEKILKKDEMICLHCIYMDQDSWHYYKEFTGFCEKMQQQVPATHYCGYMETEQGTKINNNNKKIEKSCNEIYW